MPGDLSEQVEDDLGGDFCVGVVELWREFESEFPGVFDDTLPHGLAESAESLVEGLFVEVPCRDGEGGDGRPGLRVARLVEGEEVVEGSCRGVTLGEGIAEVPGSSAGWRSARCGGTRR